jgi:hypothetical protein
LAAQDYQPKIANLKSRIGISPPKTTQAHHFEEWSLGQGKSATGASLGSRKIQRKTYKCAAERRAARLVAIVDCPHNLYGKPEIHRKT